MNLNLQEDSIIKIKIPLFGSNLKVYITDACDMPTNPPDDALGAFNYNRGIIWVNRKNIKDEISFLSTLSHECTHAAFAVIAYVAGGEYPTDVVGEENICYIQDYLMQQVLKRIQIKDGK